MTCFLPVVPAICDDSADEMSGLARAVSGASDPAPARKAPKRAILTNEIGGKETGDREECRWGNEDWGIGEMVVGVA